MPLRPTRRARPRLDRLESRDTPGNAFGDFFSDLVGRAEVLTYYGSSVVKDAFEHGPSVHAQSPKQRREQRALQEIARAHANEGSVPTVATTRAEPSILDPSSATTATT